MGVSEIRGYLYWGPSSKEILLFRGSKLGYLIGVLYSKEVLLFWGVYIRESLIFVNPPK